MLGIKILSFAAYIVSYIINRLVFIKIVNLRAPLKLRLQKKPLIYAFWHGRLFYMIFNCRNKDITVMTSTSKDGEIISTVLDHYGFNTVRGSSTKKGNEAALKMFRLLKRNKECAIAVDGPVGPERVLKPGVFHLAKATGAAIVPMAAAFKRFKVIHSWDRFYMPMPFSRGVITFGDPLYVPEDADETQYIKLITEKLNETTELADRLAGQA